MHTKLISGDGSSVLFIKVSIFQGVLLRGFHCTDPSTSRSGMFIHVHTE